MLDLEQGGCTKSKWHQERLPRLDTLVMFPLAQDTLGYAAQVNRSRSSGSRPFLASAWCSPFSVLRLSMSFPLSDPPVGNTRWFATTHWNVVLAARGDPSNDRERPPSSEATLRRLDTPSLWRDPEPQRHPTCPESMTNEFVQKAWRDLPRDRACQGWWTERTPPETI